MSGNERGGLCGAVVGWRGWVEGGVGVGQGGGAQNTVGAPQRLRGYSRRRPPERGPKKNPPRRPRVCPLGASRHGHKKGRDKWGGRAGRPCLGKKCTVQAAAARADGYTCCFCCCCCCCPTHTRGRQATGGTTPHAPQGNRARGGSGVVVVSVVAALVHVCLRVKGGRLSPLATSRRARESKMGGGRLSAELPVPASFLDLFAVATRFFLACSEKTRVGRQAGVRLDCVGMPGGTRQQITLRHR